MFVPLGGSGEIGMNLNLYGHGDRWLMVDCGISFDHSRGDTDIVMPDPEFIVKRRRSLLGLVVTHVHEDHLGAIASLWPQLRCPVYATPFTAEILRRKLYDVRLLDDVPLFEIPVDGKVSLPPFDLRFVGITHSTVECSALVIETPLGTVVHTGDFKIDPDPLVGPVTDEATLRLAGERGVLAVISDSTNATKPGRTQSEGELRPHLVELLGRLDRRVAIASFASNIARVATFIEAAKQVDRHPVIVGRSLLRMIAAARRTGYLPRFETEVSPRDIGYLPPNKVLLICTGTQGEHEAALARISRDEHRDVFLERGDAVVFSSKIIPGNERPIEALHHRLRESKIDVISEREHFVHVSGHPARGDLELFYSWTRPQIVVPVHGEQRHMEAQAELATGCGVPQTVVPFNGAVVRLAPGPAEIVGRVPAGRLRIQGERLVPV